MKNKLNITNHPSCNVTVLNTGVFMECTRSLKLNVFKLWYLTSKDVRFDTFEGYPEKIKYSSDEDINIIKIGNKCFLKYKKFIQFTKILSIEEESRSMYNYLDDIVFSITKDLDDFAKNLLLSGNKKEIEQYIESLESLFSESLPY